MRVLQTSARMYLGRDLQQDDVKVIADESGALTDVQNLGFSGSQGGGFQSQGFGTSANATGAFGGTSTAATDLGNRVMSNLGRAKAVSVANGRILSFIEVDDLPQVRINVRFYEVDRRDLLSYAPEFEVLYSDFNQPELVPGKVADAAQGGNAADVGAFSNTDVQNVFGFLADGYTQQLQISGEHLAINAAFTILETRELARRLSAPSLLVLSGEQALFQVGGEIPITETFTPTAEVGTFNSVFFKTFGVQLGVRPLVDEYDAITLDVVSQVSEPDDELTVELRETTGENPASTAFDLRSIGTSARLEDGQVLLIGGLTGLRTNDGAVFTPWVQELPLIGWLFKRFEMTDEDRDLVVMVNPVIVRKPLPEVALWSFPGVDGMLRDLGR
jgi:Flp pilus assembly secretin CpaC